MIITSLATIDLHTCNILIAKLVSSVRLLVLRYSANLTLWPSLTAMSVNILCSLLVNSQPHAACTLGQVRLLVNSQPHAACTLGQVRLLVDSQPHAACTLGQVRLLMNSQPQASCTLGQVTRELVATSSLHVSTTIVLIIITTSVISIL